MLIKLCHLICFNMFPNTVAIFVESGGYSAPYQVCQSAVTETETSVGLWHWELHESPQKRTLWEKNLIWAHAHLVKGKKCSNQTVEKCSVDRSGTVSPGEGGVGVGPYFHFPHPWARKERKYTKNCMHISFNLNV